MVDTDERLQGETQERPRTLPASITIPDIRGEMVYLRPATMQDLDAMETINAYVNASGVTGKDRVAERAAVHAWVRRSIAWQEGAQVGSGIDDPEQRRTVAWAVMTTPEDCESEIVDANNATQFIGMIFLIDIDGWARSARIQVILGTDYRGRSYSRDAMPRVMTYGFADMPEGLGLHRIWVAVPEKNTRALSVYQSLGFVPSGTSRDALWDNKLDKYQDLIVLDTLVDEYDPVQAMDAFGMHVIKSNPGMAKAFSAHEHSMAIRQQHLLAQASADVEESTHAMHADLDETASLGERIKSDSARIAHDNVDSENAWPYNSAERNTSNKAWWRSLGSERERRSRKVTNTDDAQ